MRRQNAFAPSLGLRIHRRDEAKCGMEQQGVSNRTSTLRRAKMKMCSNNNDEEKDEVKLEHVMGHMENDRVRPKMDINADETTVLIKLRRMLSEEDFNRIFNSRDRRIGEL